MPNQLTAAVANGILAAADLNTNWDLIEATALDLGPYVITGLVPSAGAGLSVNVTSGTAVIGMRVTKASSFTISGLAASSVNHLYLKHDGTTAHNTTGTAPAQSVKLGTATTDATTVTSVDTTRAGGRQTKVDLTTVVTTTDANAFTAQQTMGLNDGVATISRPLVIRHANSSGVGAIGIGAGIEIQVETATESLYNAVARVDARAAAVTAGAVTGALELSVPSAGTMAVRMTIEPTVVTLGAGVNFNTNGGSLIAGAAAFAGAIGGSGVTSFSLKRFALTFPSDANYALLTGEADAVVIDVQAGVTTATRDIIVPTTGSAFYIILNRNAQAVRVKTAAGTGITVAGARAAMVYFPTGANAFRLTPDVDWSV